MAVIRIVLAPPTGFGSGLNGLTLVEEAEVEVEGVVTFWMWFSGFRIPKRAAPFRASLRPPVSYMPRLW